MKSTISLATVLCIALAGILFLGAPAFSADEDSFALGDLDEDYVYTPVEPCRIVDTREVGGAFSAARNAVVIMFSEMYRINKVVPAPDTRKDAQAPNRCKSRAQCTSTSRRQMRTHSGWFTVWAYDGNKPAASMVNYTPGQNIANQGTIKTNPKRG